MEHSILLPGKDRPEVCIFANVTWPMVHPQRNTMGRPVEIWCNGLDEPNSSNSFIPVSSIMKRIIYSIDEVQGEKVLITIPLIE